MVRQTLPTHRTSFIGRERAGAELHGLLTAARLVTITGGGGSGKTRLALHVAGQARPADGAFWVDLAPLSDPQLLARAVAAALGAGEDPARAPSELLRERLRGRAPLLVLDNCEHLRDDCARLLAELLAADNGLRVLATSRAPLGAAGELAWPAPLLELPDPRRRQGLAELGQVEAIRLFVERARAVLPDFALTAQNRAAVTQICRRLEGLPLAIELAAARVALLAPQQIAERLDTSLALLTRPGPASDARHTMLRAALDWSYALLSAPEQRLFARLALFRGGFTLDAVEGVCAAGLGRDSILDLIAALHEKSLLVAGEAGETMRYRLLEPVRQYAAGHLDAGAAAAWRGSHCDYFLAAAERAAAHLDGPEQAASLRWFDREHDNLRAALGWCEAAGEHRAGLRIAATLALFWGRRGHCVEGQRWLQLFLGRAAPGAEPELHVRALNASAALFARQTDFAAARAQLQRSLALARHAEDEEGMAAALVELGSTLWELGDFGAARDALDKGIALCRAGARERLLPRALMNLGLVCTFEGEGAAARSLLEQALGAARRLGNHTLAATVLLNLANLASQSGDAEGARRRYDEALALYRALEIPSGAADALVNLALVAIEQGDLAAAAVACDEAEALYRELDNQGDLAYVVANRGEIALAAGRPAEAQRHYEHALTLFRAAGNRRLVARCLDRLGAIAAREGLLGAAAERCAEALALRRAIPHWPGVASSLDGGLLALAAAAGLPAVAARLLGAADAARRALGRPRKAGEEHDTAAARRSLLAALGEGGFAALWGEGQAMSIEEAAAYALAGLSVEAVARPRPELRVLALGSLRVYRGERLLTSADWAYAKARELVLHLLCHQHASREQVGVDLWPDASAEQVRQRFSAALAHARGALGREVEWLTLADGRYSFNRALPFWFDVEAFEGACAEASRLIAAEGQAERAARLLEEALGLYHGDLADALLDGEWLVPRREALRQVYLEALLALARLHGAAGRDDQALALYRRALAADPYVEEAHHALIRAALRRGRRDQALAQYEALAAALAELGAAPDPAIAALAERARRGGPL